MKKRYNEQEVTDMAKRLLGEIIPSDERATIVGLTGELGAGKTTLTKALARELGVDTDVQSPTFVVMKTYEPKIDPFTKLVHMDAYRIDSLDELTSLRFADILQTPNTLVVIEWPERIAGALPLHTLYISIEHDNDHRVITYGSQD